MYRDILALAIFLFVGAFSPGPNNLLASYSGFNFGIRKTLPLIYGVTFGFPIVLIAVNSGLTIVFNQFPLIQNILKYLDQDFYYTWPTKLRLVANLKKKK